MAGSVSMSPHEPRLVVSMDFRVLSLTPLSPTIFPPSLQQESWEGQTFVLLASFYHLKVYGNLGMN